MRSGTGLLLQQHHQISPLDSHFRATQSLNKSHPCCLRMKSKAADQIGEQCTTYDTARSDGPLQLPGQYYITVKLSPALPLDRPLTRTVRHGHVIDPGHRGSPWTQLNADTVAGHTVDQLVNLVHAELDMTPLLAIKCSITLNIKTLSHAERRY